jgi:Pregnancy-associated plasma protein-A
MKLVRPCRYLLTLAVLLAAGFAAPAADAPAARDAACAPAASGSAARVASTRDARGVVREPELNDAAVEVPDSAKGKGGPGFRATVPSWFHVITDGATGAVSDETIAAQLGAQNAGFAGTYGGANTGFKFRLAGVDRTNNAEWFNARAGSKAERDMKKALRVGGADTLNVYTTSGAGFLGWAYFPSTYKTRPYLDGIVMDYRSMPGGPYGSQFSLGFTRTHEAGHWLGLYHTFQGGCNAKGDYVDDTPFERTPTSGCPEGKDTCTEPGLDPIHNYMDYSYDSCYTQFTPGQSARMQDQYLVFRAT